MQGYWHVNWGGQGSTSNLPNVRQLPLPSELQPHHDSGSVNPPINSSKKSSLPTSSLVTTAIALLHQIPYVAQGSVVHWYVIVFEENETLSRMSLEWFEFNSISLCIIEKLK